MNLGLGIVRDLASVVIKFWVPCGVFLTISATITFPEMILLHEAIRGSPRLADCNWRPRPGLTWRFWRKRIYSIIFYSMILNIFSTQPQFFDYSVSPATVSQYYVTLYACNSDKEMASKSLVRQLPFQMFVKKSISQLRNRNFRYKLSYGHDK